MHAIYLLIRAMISLMIEAIDHHQGDDLLDDEGYRPSSG
jgi:hypothetical protein